jgi:hypothetical protein
MNPPGSEDIIYTFYSLVQRILELELNFAVMLKCSIAIGHFKIVFSVGLIQLNIP